MKPKIYFLDSKNEFSSEDKKKISAVIDKVFRDASKILGIETNVNFTIYRFGKKNGGFTQARDWIAVTVPTKGAIDYRDLEAMLYHELHHIARGYSGYLEKGQHFLLNTLFSEGLATAFEVEKQAKGRKSSHDTYTVAFVKKWLPEIQKEFYNTKYDYEAWFHGKGKPKQLGYKIGKYLSDEVRKHYPTLTHKDLVKIDAKKLLKLSKAG